MSISSRTTTASGLGISVVAARSSSRSCTGPRPPLVDQLVADVVKLTAPP